MTAENMLLHLSGTGLTNLPYQQVVSLVLLCGMNAGSLVALQLDSRGFLVTSGTTQ